MRSRTPRPAACGWAPVSGELQRWMPCPSQGALGKQGQLDTAQSEREQRLPTRSWSGQRHLGCCGQLIFSSRVSLFPCP